MHWFSGGLVLQNDDFYFVYISFFKVLLIGDRYRSWQLVSEFAAQLKSAIFRFPFSSYGNFCLFSDCIILKGIQSHICCYFGTAFLPRQRVLTECSSLITSLPANRKRQNVNRPQQYSENFKPPSGYLIKNNINTNVK